MKSMEHHVRFDDNVSECNSELSWFSYISDSGKFDIIVMVMVMIMITIIIISYSLSLSHNI